MNYLNSWKPFSKKIVQCPVLECFLKFCFQNCWRSQLSFQQRSPVLVYSWMNSRNYLNSWKTFWEEAIQCPVLECSLTVCFQNCCKSQPLFQQRSLVLVYSWMNSKNYLNSWKPFSEEKIQCPVLECLLRFCVQNCWRSQSLF